MITIVNYVYSVIDYSAPKSFGCIGLKGTEVLTEPCEDISAVVSRIPESLAHCGLVVEPIEANWLKHDEVVRRLMTEHTVIPVKFGSVLRNDRDLKAMLRRLLSECRAELKHLRNRVEMGVKIMAAEQDLKQEASRERTEIGRFKADLLRARSLMIKGKRVSLGEAVERHLDAISDGGRQELCLEESYYARRFHDMLVKFTVESKVNQLLSSDMILNASFLLDRNSIEHLKTKLSELSNLYPSFQFLLSGPWAPYNFTRIKYY